MSVKVNIISRQRKIKLPEGTKDLIKQACKTTLLSEGFNDKFEVDVTLVNDRMIHEINLECRNIDKATDVLSFPLCDGGEFDIDPATGRKMLGDIVISVERALYQADLYGHSIRREVAFLTVHSMLHLLGYDHINNKEEEKVMFAKQEEILALMGLETEK